MNTKENGMSKRKRKALTKEQNITGDTGKEKPWKIYKKGKQMEVRDHLETIKDLILKGVKVSDDDIDLYIGIIASDKVILRFNKDKTNFVIEKIPYK